MELSANKIFRTVAANPANYDDGNYEIYGELRVEKVPDSGVFQKTLGAFLLPDEDDNAVFELQDGAADFYPLNDFNPGAVNTIQLINDNQVRAQFYSAESFGTPPVLSTLNLMSTFRILKGGRPKIYSGDFFSQIATQKRFLSWHPGNKKVDFNQPEILHFYVSNGITSLTQKVKVFFSDDTDTTVTAESDVSVLEDRIYRIPAGYFNLQVHTVDPAKRVVKYETWLEDQSANIVANPFSYVIEDVNPSTVRYWLYTNSLGMWEIMRTDGIAQDEFQVNRQPSQVYLPQGYQRWKGEMEVQTIGSENILNVSSGYLESKDEALWATDFLLTEKLLLVQPSKRVPYVLNSNSFVRYEDKNYKYFLRFEAKLAYNDTKYGLI